MNVTRLILAFSMALAVGVAAASPQPANTWDSLVGMKYAKARKEVIDAGWRQNGSASCKANSPNCVPAMPPAATALTSSSRMTASA
jgi:hypothetical protein